MHGEKKEGRQTEGGSYRPSRRVIAPPHSEGNSGTGSSPDQAYSSESEREKEAMTPNTNESIDELSAWYEQVYIPALGNGSNVHPRVTSWNLAIMKDAVSSYRTWRSFSAELNRWRCETEAINDTDPEFFPRTQTPVLYTPDRSPGDPGYLDYAEAQHGTLAKGPERIHIDARRFYETPGPQPQRFFRCGNCGAKLFLSGDAERDHHTAQAHKVEACQKRIEAAMDHRALLAEMRERNEQPLKIAVKKPWWKIW